MTVHGVPEFVLVRGRICVEDGVVRVAEGFGRFIPSPLRSAFVYDAIEGKEEGQNGQAQIENKIDQLESQITVPQPPSVMFARNATPESAQGSQNHVSGARGRVDGKRDLQESSFSISGKWGFDHVVEWVYFRSFDKTFIVWPQKKPLDTS